MQTRTNTVAFAGIDAQKIEVQCLISPGPASLNIVGLPGQAIKEARDRISASFHSLQIALPPARVTFNLAPADLPKLGSHFDLPIAISLLANLELLPADEIAKMIAIGALNLDGTLAPSKGVLPAGLLAMAEGHEFICPAVNLDEIVILTELVVLAPGALGELLDHYRGTPIVNRATNPPPEHGENADEMPIDMRMIRGLEAPKRALEIAAAGRHHLLMVGPPGGGKSTLAQAMAGILPPLTRQEQLENMMIASCAGRPQMGSRRPFLDPHHSASLPALVGGGREAEAGQITFANNGVLFLDEMPEFSRDALEALRTPLETHKIHIARVNAHTEYPAKFQLIGTANPCQCGLMLNPESWCGRAPRCGQNYMSRLSGPLLDRFSLRVLVTPPLIPLFDMAEGEPTAKVATRVWRARQRQYARNGAGVANEDMAHDIFDALVAALDGATRRYLDDVTAALALSPRSYFRLVKTAATIADLGGRSKIAITDLEEAVALRVIDAHNQQYSPTRYAINRTRQRYPRAAS